MTESNPKELTGKIEIKAGQYFSVVGESKLPLSEAVGKTILALRRIQDKLLDRNYKSSIFKIWLMLNCRKAANLIRGDASLGEITDPTLLSIKRTSEIESALSRDERDLAGIVQMFKDLREFIKSGRRTVLFGKNDIEAGFLDSEFYNQHWLDSVLVGAQFPQTLHIFEFKANTPLDVRKRLVEGTVSEEDFLKLGFTHTVEILGKGEDGRIHCVHKTGPKPTDKVIIHSGKELQKWLRYGSEKPSSAYDQYGLVTFVAISGQLDI